MKRPFLDIWCVLNLSAISTCMIWPQTRRPSRSEGPLPPSCGLLIGFSALSHFSSRPLSRGSSQPRVQTQASHIAGRFFTIWATREAPCSSQQVKYKWCRVTALLNLPPMAPSSLRGKARSQQWIWGPRNVYPHPQLPNTPLTQLQLHWPFCWIFNTRHISAPGPL